MLPPFDARGVLPPGDYSLTISQLRASVLVVGGPGCAPNWNSERRAWLVDQLELLVRPLWQVGIERIWIDGSFVENAASPGDIDGYFEVDPSYFHFGHLERDLQKLKQPSTKIWVWSPFSQRPNEEGKGKLPGALWADGMNTASNFTLTMQGCLRDCVTAMAATLNLI